MVAPLLPLDSCAKRAAAWSRGGKGLELGVEEGVEVGVGVALALSVVLPVPLLL